MNQRSQPGSLMTRKANPKCSCGAPSAKSSWYCLPCKRRVSREWRKKNPQSGRRHQRDWRNRNRHKYNAQRMVRKRVRSGKIVRPNSCQVCGILGKPQAHHDNYSKPLEVMWLCAQCHNDRHRARAALQRERK